MTKKDVLKIVNRHIKDIDTKINEYKPLGCNTLNAQLKVLKELKKEIEKMEG